MKVSKIPGLGRFGVFIDDVDFFTMSDDQWMEIGKIHLESLVTIIRDTELDRYSYVHWMKKWGMSRMSFAGTVRQKYPDWDGKVASLIENPNWEDYDKKLIFAYLNIMERPHLDEAEIIRVMGGRDENGKPMGMFAEGELLWHSNESGNIAGAPGVALLGLENTTKSATGFLTTVDYYENVPDSFRKELDEMVLIHNFIPCKINPGLNEEQDTLMYSNMVPLPNTEIPMVIKSPGGHKGLHYSFNTVTSIKDMSEQESNKTLEYIRKGLEKEEYIYDHWYQQDGDLCLFDNSITQHRRLGETTGRLCLRYQYDYNNLVSEPYIPYEMEPYKSNYIRDINHIIEKLPNAREFKLP